MKIAINQPYFFPYLGYYSLIKHTDEFILMDTFQFVKQSWMRRNRILKNPEGWCYIMLPCTNYQRNTRIMDVKIDNRQDWKKEILRKLHYYKKPAPYYSSVIGLVEDLFANEYFDITTLNRDILSIICEYLDIPCKIHLFSKLGYSIENINESDEWALNICKVRGNVKEYWNLPSGKDFYNADKYRDAGIDIKFPKNNLRPYDQKRSSFEPGLSILDVLMFNDKSVVHEMLDDLEFI